MSLSKDTDTEEEFSEDNNSNYELSLDDDDKEFLDNLSTDSEIYIFIKYGYLVKIDEREEIVLDPKDYELLDSGLVTGLSQNDDVVDLFFVKNGKYDNISFSKDFILGNNKKYRYDKVKIKLSNGESLLVSSDDHEFIFKFDDEAYDMFSSVLNQKQEDSCVISIFNSEICACSIQNGKISWIEPIDLGKNTFDEENSSIIKKNGEKYDISDCFLRVCVKKIYLHVESIEPFGSLILGKTDNPMYKNNFTGEEV